MEQVANFIPNPSFEHDVVGGAPAGWSTTAFSLNPDAVLTATSVQAHVGSQSMLVKAVGTNVAEGAACACPSIDFKSGTTYRASVWLRGKVGGEKVQVIFGATLDDDAVVNATLTTEWQRITVAWTPSAERSGTTHGLAIRTPAGSPTAIEWYADAAQVEEGALPVGTYVDGDTPGYFWSGTPGNSTTVFTVQESAAPAVMVGRSVAAAQWEWLLCDGKGVPLAELTTAAGKQLTFKRNTYSEAQFTISHEDDAAYPFFEALKNGPLPTLRCYRRGVNDTQGILRFNGYLAPFTEELEEKGLLTAIFRSPFGRLIGDGNEAGRYTAPFQIIAGEALDYEIAASLIKLYGGLGTLGATDPVFGQTYEEPYSVGLGIGTLGGTGAKRIMKYKCANVGQSIILLTQALDGFDFDETFVEEGPTLALFNTYAELGKERPEALFQYGPDTLANVRRVQRTTAAPLNTLRLIGGAGLVAESNVGMEQSLERYGRWMNQQQVTGQPVMEALEARCKSLLRPDPIRVLKFEPDLGLDNCPKPWDDFFLGDLVPFYGKLGAFEDSVLGRVNELQVVIDENGYETAAIPDPHTMLAIDRHNRTDLLHTSFSVESSSAI